jgi:hypothetical protein
MSTLRITSVPAGAGIVIDGRDTGQVTPAEIQVGEGPPPRQVRLTRRGAPPHDIVVTPELIAGGEIAATLPPLPEPAPAQTRVAVTSSYPVEIVDGERVLSPAGESHELTIAGRRTLRMRALDYYLDRPIQVDGSGRPIEVTAPGLGRLTVRSPLETCPVTLDGHSLGFPPITGITVAAGTYRLELSCPDGGSRQATITVRPGEPLLQIIR